jgi:hypothetical protein
MVDLLSSKHFPLFLCLLPHLSSQEVTHSAAVLNCAKYLYFSSLSLLLLPCHGASSSS